jgi:hypothetical protein
MDVITAFLNSKLLELIHMELPDGYKIPGKIALLLRSLYGLKQSPRQWYGELNSFLISLGFERSKADEALYLKKGCWVLVYVDDLFITGWKREVIDIKSRLSTQFKMKDLGDLALFLGMEVTRNRAKKLLVLHQTQYLMRILEVFDMAECNAVATPFPPGIQLVALPLDSQGQPIGVLDHDRYRTLVGSLLYASTHIRIDIAFTVGVLSRYLNAPGLSHWRVAKHLLRYIKGTIEYGLIFDGTCIQDLIIHADSDYATQVDTRKSTTGYVTILAGTAVTWNSTLQNTVAQSTMEAEYVALAEAVKEALWLSKLFRELRQYEKLPGIQDIPTISSDNDAALILAKNPEKHQKAKHIDIKYHLIRDEYDAGRIHLQRVATADNRADILTKALMKQMHRDGILKLGMA